MSIVGVGLADVGLAEAVSAEEAEAVVAVPVVAVPVVRVVVVEVVVEDMAGGVADVSADVIKAFPLLDESGVLGALIEWLMTRG